MRDIRDVVPEDAKADEELRKTLIDYGWRSDNQGVYLQHALRILLMHLSRKTKEKVEEAV